MVAKELIRNWLFQDGGKEADYTQYGGQGEAEGCSTVQSCAA